MRYSMICNISSAALERAGASNFVAGYTSTKDSRLRPGIARHKCRYQYIHAGVYSDTYPEEQMVEEHNIVSVCMC